MRRIVFIAFLFFPLLLSAQPGGGDPGGDPDRVPLTGIEWLLLTGGIFGARKIYKGFKNR